MTGRIAVFVDSGYLFKAGGQAIGESAATRKDFVFNGSVAVELLSETAKSISGNELLRVYWYDAAWSTPTVEHRRIAELDHVKVRLGQMNSIGQQKGVDPLIITDMIALARNRACGDFLLVSGDADLLIGVTQAQEQGVRVHLLGIGASRSNQAPSLRQEVDTCHEWKSDTVTKFLTISKDRLGASDPHALHQQTEITLAKGKWDGLAATESVATGNGDQIQPTFIGKPQPPSSKSQVRSGSSPPGSASEDLIRAEGCGFTDADFRIVAEEVARQISGADRIEILSSSQPGIIPGSVDRKLMGTAKGILNSMLNDAEKRRLRRVLHRVCAGNTVSDLVGD